MTMTTTSEQVAEMLKEIHMYLVNKATFSLSGAGAFHLSQKLTLLEALITGLDNHSLEILEGGAVSSDYPNEDDSVPF